MDADLERLAGLRRNAERSRVSLDELRHDRAKGFCTVSFRHSSTFPAHARHIDHRIAAAC
jgi:hypothetical protein